MTKRKTRSGFFIPKSKALIGWWCNRCELVFNISQEDQDLGLLKKEMPCIGQSCSGTLHQRKRASIQAHNVRALELFQAVQGMGLPSERKCAPADVRKVLVGKKIESVVLEPAPNKDRTLIASITLEGGATVHLAPSTKGVTVYKVTHEQS